MILSLFFFVFSVAFGQEERNLTVEETVKLGLVHSKELKISVIKIQRAVSQYEISKDESLPRASVSYGYTHIEMPSQSLRLGNELLHLPQRSDGYLGTLSVKQTIFRGNSIKYAQQSKELMVQIARLDAEKSSAEISYGLIRVYYNLKEIIQNLEIARQNLLSIESQLKQAKDLFREGLVTNNDVLRFELEKTNAAMIVKELESNHRVVNENLNILLGLPEETKIKPTSNRELIKEMSILHVSVDSGLANRKELQQFGQRRQLAEIDLRRVKSEILPRIDAGINGYYFNAALNPIPSSEKYIAPLMFGATVSWDINNLWTHKHKLTEVEAKKREAQVLFEREADKIRQEVYQSIEQYKVALERIKSCEVALSLAKQNRQLTEYRYTNHIVPVTDFIDAQTQLFNAGIRLEQARSEADLAYYSMLKSTGKLMF